jgi:hypothetical protein
MMRPESLNADRPDTWQDLLTELRAAVDQLRDTNGRDFDPRELADLMSYTARQLEVALHQIQRAEAALSAIRVAAAL